MKPRRPRRASLEKRGEGAAAPSNILFGRFILSVKYPSQAIGGKR
jgi:hypothetical protein